MYLLFPYVLLSQMCHLILLVPKNGPYKQYVIISDATLLEMSFYCIIHS